MNNKGNYHFCKGNIFLICGGRDCDYEVEFETSTYIDNAIKLKDAGLTTSEQSIDYIKENKALNDSFQYDDEAELNEEMEFEFNPNNSENNI